jgi:hypothetical protein
VRTDEHAYDTVGDAKFRLDNGTVTAAACYYDALGSCARPTPATETG